jgi:DNA-binding NtrC family response regulator
MRALVNKLEQVGQSAATVLIEGETGAGKEMVAQALHGSSPRRRGPFAVFDCGATTANLAASELFGHERGAYTGADRTHSGVLAEADGGTLFLDEVGELPAEIQASLLGVLERRSYRRVGGKENLRVDVRVIAATNRNLEEQIRLGAFRRELFYRLSVIRLRVPPLRERPEDILPLAQKFAGETGAELSPDTIALLRAYAWPGNVRELRNMLARLAVEPDAAAALFDDGEPPPSLHEARRTAVDRFERLYLARLLKSAGGNMTRAAELAGVARAMITRLAAKPGMRVRDR